MLQLIDLLGPDNVHLSIYEDNPTEEAKQSLASFRQNVTCTSVNAPTLNTANLSGKSTIVAEDFDSGTLPRVTLPNGEKRLKRIAFLAEVRNRALDPIDHQGVKFDKILYLNDVNFHPIDAVQLLFATNIDSTGRTDYGAACALDFINAFKYYDRFATRDFDGRITGIPFFPFFTSAGTATSRKDMLSQSDAVRVRSCWGAWWPTRLSGSRTRHNSRRSLQTLRIVINTHQPTPLELRCVSVMRRRSSGKLLSVVSSTLICSIDGPEGACQQIRASI